MPAFRILPVVGASLLVLMFGATFAQAIDVKQLILDLKAAEKEEAAAKEVRLKWISTERTRIQGERQKFEKELNELKEIIPDPNKPRVVAPAIDKDRNRAQIQANGWAINNNPAMNAAIMKGEGLNALLRVLGPLAHHRRQRSITSSTSGVFPSLKDAIRVEEVNHYRLSPATSAGSKVLVRLNQLPLELQWPAVVIQNWNSDCQSLQKLRDEYVTRVVSAGASENQTQHLATAELFDKGLELLQAKVLQKRQSVPRDTSLSGEKRAHMHRDLLEALRYLETVRATAERLKNAPGDYKVHLFPGGSIEDFLDFSYTHGMVFGEARPADQAHYQALLRRMQDYAHDIQFVEDWKANLEQRIRELNADDQKLVWHASEQ